MNTALLTRQIMYRIAVKEEAKLHKVLWIMFPAVASGMIASGVVLYMTISYLQENGVFDLVGELELDWDTVKFIVTDVFGLLAKERGAASMFVASCSLITLGGVLFKVKLPSINIRLKQISHFKN